jgi:pilus assembly protein Flp/PilA
MTHCCGGIVDATAGRGDTWTVRLTREAHQCRLERADRLSNTSTRRDQMEKMYTMLTAFYTAMYARDESEDRGAGMVEYALLVAVIALVAVVGATALGLGIDGLFKDANGKL